MKKNLPLLILALLLSATGLQAQVNDTYVVTDNGPRLSSCVDSLISFPYIFERAGIRDLNDPNDNISNYRMLELDGSVITNREITGSFRYSDYDHIFVEKTTVPFNGHNGVELFFNIIAPPAVFFKADTLKYTVERGAKVNYVKDFFDTLNVWVSGMDNVSFQDRLLFTDFAAGTELPITQSPEWGIAGPGEYRIRIAVAICSPADLRWDSIFVIVEESPCHNIKIKNIPSVCRDEVLDITPYVYVDGHVATSSELTNMTFMNRSDIFNPNNGNPVDPTAIDIAPMWNTTALYPNIEIIYQPNVALQPGVTCQKFAQMLNTKVPTKLAFTDLVIARDNEGNSRGYTLDGEFYATNNVFYKNVLQELYIDSYNMFDGTTLSFYTDELYQNPVSGSTLAPGDYHVLATNTDCANDSTDFSITVKNRDFDIIWQSAPALGRGYYTFNAPQYAGATYAWFIWGGSIIGSHTTDQLTVYYSENAAKSVTVNCQITFPVLRTSAANTQNAAVYLMQTDSEGTLEEIGENITLALHPGNSESNLSVAYPNPSEGEFVLTGNGMFEMKVYNALGQLVYEDPAYTPNTAVNISSKGIHVIHLNQAGKSQTLKVMLK